MLRTAHSFGIWFFASLVLVLASPRLGWPAKYNKKKLNQALKHYNQASALYAQGQRDAAIGEYRAALRLDGDEPYWHEALGVALEKQGDSAGALSEYCVASQLSPHDSGLQSKCQSSGSVTSGVASERVETAVPEQRTYQPGKGVSAPLSSVRP